MIERRSQLDKIIITAMDRFVWFVLLVVISHLVTEFTRVTGYSRGHRNEIVLINDSLIQPMPPVQNMLLYPNYEYNQHQQPSANTLQQNAALLLSSLGGSNSGGSGNSDSFSNPAATTNSESTYPLFSFRPIIDSIFDIPISTLRAVNNLVGRLTGSYRQAASSPSAPEIIQKSSSIITDATEMQLRLPLNAKGNTNRNAGTSVSGSGAGVGTGASDSDATAYGFHLAIPQSTKTSSASSRKGPVLTVMSRQMRNEAS